MATGREYVTNDRAEGHDPDLPLPAFFQHFCRPRLRPEALTIFAGDDERLDHLGVDKVAVELIQFIQPEVVAIEV